MNLYWVIVYALYTKFPFSDRTTAERFYNLACIYHPDDVDIINYMEVTY